MSVYLSVSTHGRISWSIFAKSGTEVTTPKGKNEFDGVRIAPPLSLFWPQKPACWPKGPEKPCKQKYANFCLKCSQIVKNPASYRKTGLVVDVRSISKVEIRQLSAHTLKKVQYNLNLWPNRRKWWSQDILSETAKIFAKTQVLGQKMSQDISD